MSAALIKRTQEELGRYVKKPPLTEKLLSKPPFRFLHDVITSVMKSNPGVLEGLYTDEEMLSENVKDRDGKIRYLEKVRIKNLFLERRFLQEGGHGKIYYGGRN